MRAETIAQPKPRDSIPCSNPLAQYRAMKAEIDAAVMSCLASGRYVLGEEVAGFEREFADYLGAADVVGVGNGTEAIALALRTAGVGRGAEVITTPLTAVATVAAIESVGATPVLADIEPGACTLDAERVAEAVTDRTRALVPVHLYGCPADMSAMLALAAEHGLTVIEDCAQAAGARCGAERVGAIGAFGCFSFYPTKNLGALGDGGAIAVRQPAQAERLRRLRQYGWDEGRRSLEAGVNSRLDSLQAVILRVKLAHLDAMNARRREIANRYREGLADLPLTLPAAPPGREHVYHLFVIRTAERDRLLRHLGEYRISAGIHYPRPVHKEPAYEHLGRGADLSQAERAAAQVLSLPMYPELDDQSVDHVVRATRAFFGAA